MTTIDNFLAKTPLHGEGSDFVDDSKLGGLNPYLIVANAGAESQFGATAPAGTNNDFGLLRCQKGKGGKVHCAPYRYLDVNDAINAAVSTVEKQFVNGNTTVAQLYNGNPGAYCVGVCSTGEGNVDKFFRQLSGGRDPNNPLNLLWPCKNQA